MTLLITPIKSYDGEGICRRLCFSFLAYNKLGFFVGRLVSVNDLPNEGLFLCDCEKKNDDERLEEREIVRISNQNKANKKALKRRMSLIAASVTMLFAGAGYCNDVYAEEAATRKDDLSTGRSAGRRRCVRLPWKLCI